MYGLLVTLALIVHTSLFYNFTDRLNSRHHALLFEQLQNHAARWREIGTNLGFAQGELNIIQASPLLLMGAPRSWLSTLLTQWLEWAPGDGRGSQVFATLEGLKDALRRSGLGATAHELHL